ILNLFDGTTEVVTVLDGGNVGIGTTSPGYPLHIFNDCCEDFLIEDNEGTRIVLDARGQDTYVGAHSNHPLRFVVNNSPKMSIATSGNVGIGTTDPAQMLDVAGTILTDVLMIDGGADIAEPFEFAGADIIEPGMVVAIDPANPGQLRIADNAYDRTVAGVISGAGGINSGLVMKQEGAITTGSHPVALTGRVYVWADATNDPIQPGDLLTTSDTPGHAMAVTDYDRAHGAILGKAMSSLDEGQELVLVLVTLQ
ncbi:MAG: hypothetical protein GY790_12870, partial [Bacteroidetes bacterium]|nr:hypothetical protein [Bacteroidota bacterium]